MEAGLLLNVAYRLLLLIAEQNMNGMQISKL